MRVRVSVYVAKCIVISTAGEKRRKEQQTRNEKAKLRIFVAYGSALISVSRGICRVSS